MPQIAVCRKPFVHNGEQYLPGDPVPDWSEWPRPEHSLHVGLIVLKDVEPEPDTALVSRKPVPRKPKVS